MAKDIQSTEATAAAGTGPKNFKSNQDIESFYRFIHENNLRSEASALMQTILKTFGKKRKKRKSKVIQ